MPGEIHGMVSREQAWHMWQPYGERDAMVDDALGDIITPIEASLIYRGADELAQRAILRHTQKNKQLSFGQQVAAAIEEQPNNAALDELLRDNYEQQRRYVDTLRSQELDNSLIYVRTLGAAALALNTTHFLDNLTEDELIARLIGPDGQPALQYAPLTFLAYHRLAALTDKIEPTITADVTPATDFNYGIIRAPIGLNKRNQAIATHGKLHEWVHASIAGTEFYDITNDMGGRSPYWTANGLAITEPTTEVGLDGQDMSNVSNFGVAEGWVDFITKQLMKHDASLGRRLKDNSYDKWSDTVRYLRRRHPKVYAAITSAALIEADPSHANLKHGALARMHQIADAEFGENGALNRIFEQQID